jgi:hypothetical protein
MTKDEALRLALEALSTSMYPQPRQLNAIAAIKATLEAKDEPVAWYRNEDGIRIYYETKAWDDCIPLYTTPPQRTWVGLTDEQFLEACQMAEGGNYMVAFQRIQQWLKENNT